MAAQGKAGQKPDDLTTTCRACRCKVEPAVAWALTTGGPRDTTIRLYCPRCGSQIRRVPQRQAAASKWRKIAPPEPAENLRLFDTNEAYI